MNDREQRELARRITELERRLGGLSAQQLNRSSLEDGSIKEYSEGQLVSVIGQQFDGAHGVQVINGPTPPRPGPPTVAGVLNGIRIEYLATDADDRPMVVPTDFARFEVHVGISPTGLGVNTIPRTTIESPRGGTITPAVSFNTDYYVAIVCVATSGKRSAPSDVVGPVRALQATAEDLDVDFEELRGTRIFYGPDTPTTAKADLWLKEPDNVAYRYDIVSQTWVKVQDQGIVKALQDAKTAGDAANKAGIDALAAQGAANTAQTTANNAGAAALTADQKAQAAANVAAGKTTTFRQDSPPSTTGRTVGDEWYETDMGNRLHIWNGTVWTLTQAGVDAISATARQLGAITTYRQATAPASGMLLGDFWIDSDDNVLYRWEGSTPSWVKVQDVNIQTAITNAATAQAVADGKMRIFAQTTAPTGLLAIDVGDMWIDTDDGNKVYTWVWNSATSTGSWQARLLGNSSIEPKSLIASNVVATGTITASLFEASLVLATTIIAGAPLGDHARMTPTGFRVFAADPIDNVPNEVVRMGTDTNDYLAVVNSAGNLVASVDDTGRASFDGLTVNSDPYFGGKTLSQIITERTRENTYRGVIYLGNFDQRTPQIRNEVGLAQFVFPCVAGRTYSITVNGPFVHWGPGTDTELSALYRIATTTGTTPAQATITSQEIHREYRSGLPEFYWQNMNASFIWDSGTTGLASLLISMLVYFGPPATAAAWNWIGFNVEDLGPTNNRPVTRNAGGGTWYTGAAPPTETPKTQYYVDLAPLGWESFRGNGTKRTDVPGPVQGWDPSGFNGDGKGHWWFAIPNITGTVDRVDFYCYSNHWYYNSGGTAIFNAAVAGVPYNKQRADWHVGGYPKPGGKTVTLPSDWWPQFRSGVANRFDGVTVGPSGGSNLTYYGRFDGPSARLRIWYTQ